MDEHSSEFSNLLARVAKQDIDDQSVAELWNVTTSIESADRLIQTLVHHESLSADCLEAAVDSAMRILENIGQKSKLLACELMAHLSPVANDLLLHHIVDGIDLWWWHNKSPELSAYLLKFAASRSDANLRRHYEEMANCDSGTEGS